MKSNVCVGRGPTRAWPGYWLAIAAAVVALWAFTGIEAKAASIQPLEIVTKTGVHVFSVEMATTEEEKTTGLMYRKELADGKGMLFDFSPEQEVSMWMKNTYISLDMIFIRADGRILRIAEKHRTHVDQDHPVQRPVQGRAGSDRRHRAEIRHQARRPRRPPAVQRPLRGPDRARSGPDLVLLALSEACIDIVSKDIGV
jgi:uncharacterized membrane protein (UPF0127 family)